MLACLLFGLLIHGPFSSWQVLPCLGDNLPDGAVVTTANRLPSSGMKIYEVCSEGDADFQVRPAEPCAKAVLGRGRSFVVRCIYCCLALAVCFCIVRPRCLLAFLSHAGGGAPIVSRIMTLRAAAVYARYASPRTDFEEIRSPTNIF